MSYVRRRPKHLSVAERIVYTCELASCPSCGTLLQPCRHYSWAKTIQQLDRAIYVASRPKRCPNPSCPAAKTPFLCAAAQQLALPYSSYGLSVIAQLGFWHDHDHLSGTECHARLQGRVQISRRSVNLLLHHYRLLLACASQLNREMLTAAVRTYGGLILSLDGLEPEGAQEQLWVVREVLTGTILASGWLPRVSQPTLRAFLQPLLDLLAASHWPLLATLSDKQEVVELVLRELWPSVPHQWCQTHYLRNLAAPIQKRDQALRVDLRRDVRQALRPTLRQVAASAEEGAFSP